MCGLVDLGDWWILGMLGLGYSLWDFFHGQGFNLGRFGIGLFLFASGLQKPQLRPKTFIPKFLDALVIALILGFLAAWAWLNVVKAS
jgi:hypothetical protein